MLAFLIVLGAGAVRFVPRTVRRRQNFAADSGVSDARDYCDRRGHGYCADKVASSRGRVEESSFEAASYSG